MSNGMVVYPASHPKSPWRGSSSPATRISSTENLSKMKYCPSGFVQWSPTIGTRYRYRVWSYIYRSTAEKMLGTTALVDCIHYDAVSLRCGQDSGKFQNTTCNESPWGVVCRGLSSHCGFISWMQIPHCTAYWNSGEFLAAPADAWLPHARPRYPLALTLTLTLAGPSDNTRNKVRGEKWNSNEASRQQENTRRLCSHRTEVS